MFKIAAMALLLMPAHVGESPSVYVSTIDQAVAGFPLPLQLICDGELEVHEATIHNTLVPWKVTLTDGVGDEYVFPAQSKTSWYQRTVEARDELPDGTRIGSAVTTRIDEEEIPAIIAIGDSQVLLCEMSHHPANRYTAGQLVDEAVSMSLFPLDTYSISIDSGGIPVTYSTASLQLVSPNTTESEILSRLEEKRADLDLRQEVLAEGDPKWIAFVRYFGEITSGLDLNQLSDEGERQLQYYIILGQLVHSGMEIDELAIVPQQLVGLWPGYQIDVWLLEYEIAVAKGNQLAANALRASILAQDASREIGLDQIDQIGGLIKMYRQMN